MILAIHDVTVHVSNLAKAAAFYGDLLGLKLLSEGSDECVFDLAGIKLHIHGGARAHAADPRAGVVLTLSTRDVFTAYEHLRSEAVTFLGDVHHVEGLGNIAVFADPDGNVFRLLQSR